jgi:hypothetical protein
MRKRKWVVFGSRDPYFRKGRVVTGFWNQFSSLTIKQMACLVFAVYSHLWHLLLIRGFCGQWRNKQLCETMMNVNTCSSSLRLQFAIRSWFCHREITAAIAVGFIYTEVHIELGSAVAITWLTSADKYRDGILKLATATGFLSVGYL